jgi:type I restriction enzyme S subunit
MSVFRLGDVALKIGSGATPRGGKEVYIASGDIALIRSQNIYNDRFDRNGLAYLTQEHAKQLEMVTVQVDDILLNITGDSVARCCQVPTDVLPARVNQHVAIIRPDPKRLDPRFLRFFLVSPAMQQRMLALAKAGATRNALTKAMIEGFVIPDIAIDEQRAIGAVLGAFEDKIEHNRRVNETLEILARAIFKDWFVDFGPTRAKAEGRAPYLAPEIWALFPERLDDGDKPEGWNIGPLGRLGALTIGGDWGEDEAFAGAVEGVCLRGVDLEHLRRDGHASAPHRWFKPKSLASRAMDDRDVLVAGSGAGPTGRPLWMCADVLQALGQCVYSNFCKRIRCTSAVTAVYLDAWLHNMRVSGEIWEYVNGTSVPNLDATSLLSGKDVPIPPMAVLNKYYDLVYPIWQKKYAGESQTLAAIRDLLLPRLMSGEIRVRDAEKLVEAVA